jgi:hypothetical protein
MVKLPTDRDWTDKMGIHQSMRYPVFPFMPKIAVFSVAFRFHPDPAVSDRDGKFLVNIWDGVGVAHPWIVSHLLPEGAW